MKTEHTCPHEDCPLKNWHTKEADMKLSLQVLCDIVRSSMPKYIDYEKNKKVSSALIKEWVAKLLDALSIPYPQKNERGQIFLNIIRTFEKAYPDDGLPRDALKEFLAKEINPCS